MSDLNEREREKHPSYGLMGFSRINSNGTRFFGSELEQGNYIQMRLYQAEVEHTLTQDYFYSDGRIPLAEVRMSTGQFAEMITSMNTGDGIPCTIEMINRMPIADLPSIENRKEFVHRKFEDRMKAFAKTIRETQLKAKDLVKKKTLSKEDVRQLSIHLDWLTTEVTSNIPYFAKCFQETMDEVVLEAKLEVENAIQHKINVMGVAAIKSEMNQKLLGTSHEIYNNIIDEVHICPNSHEPHDEENCNGFCSAACLQEGN